MDQTGARSGRLTKWTKEFAFSGVEGEDVVILVDDHEYLLPFGDVDRAQVSLRI